MGGSEWNDLHILEKKIFKFLNCILLLFDPNFV